MKRTVKYLILSITDECNLECKYCYMGKRGNCVMSNEMIEKAIQLLPEEGKCHVQITGGEPGLHTDVMEYAAKTVRNHALNATIGVQTNATLINRKFTEVIRKYNIQAGISLDGRKQVNDITRGKTEEALKGLRFLENEGIDFRSTSVVSNVNAEYLYEIPLLLSAFINARGMALDMLVQKGRVKETGIKISSSEKVKEAVKKLILTLDYVNKGRDIPITLRETEKAKSYIAGSAFCHAESGESMAVAANGDVFPCGQTIGDKNFFCGNILDYDRKMPESFTRGRETFAYDRWDCPSRIHYNRNESWPDINRLISAELSQKKDTVKNIV